LISNLEEKATPVVWLVTGVSRLASNPTTRESGPISLNMEPLAMSSIIDDTDPLVAELGASLTPSQYAAFESAARDILASLTCSGPGSAYRALRDLQKAYFDPPADDPGRYAPRHYRPSKLADGPPLDEDSARGRAHARTRWMRGWRG
jgi:hypothetical protein